MCTISSKRRTTSMRWTIPCSRRSFSLPLSSFSLFLFRILQRYFFNDTYLEKNGPVFFMLGQEVSLRPFTSFLYWLKKFIFSFSFIKSLSSRALPILMMCRVAFRFGWLLAMVLLLSKFVRLTSFLSPSIPIF